MSLQRPEIQLALHNVFVLLLKDDGALSGDLSGDGTGYAISVRTTAEPSPEAWEKVCSLFSLIDSVWGCMWGVGCRVCLRWKLFTEL